MDQLRAENPGAPPDNPFEFEDELIDKVLIRLDTILNQRWHLFEPVQILTFVTEMRAGRGALNANEVRLDAARLLALNGILPGRGPEPGSKT